MFIRRYIITLKLSYRKGDDIPQDLKKISVLIVILMINIPIGIMQRDKDLASENPNGLVEYCGFYGNCTYNDDTTQGAIRLLLHIYMTTLDPANREPLLKALNFMFISQYKT